MPARIIAGWFVLCLTLVFVSSAEAVQSFPNVVTAEVDFTEGDLEKSRSEGVEKGLRSAVQTALREKIGAAALRDAEVTVRTRFLNRYEDFINRSAVVNAREDGFRLYVTVGYELDQDALENRIRSTRLGEMDARKTLAVVWSVEEPTSKKAPERTGVTDGTSKTAESEYLRAAWQDAATAPTVIDELRGVLLENGYYIRPYNEAHRGWSRGVLKNAEVSKGFLAGLGRRMDADRVLYVRLVRRQLATPRGAHLHVDRVNHVAFVVDPESGDSVGEPLAVSRIIYGRSKTEKVGTLLDVWMSQIVERLSGAEAEGLRIAFRAVPSPDDFDKLLSELRRHTDLAEILPYEVSSERVVFLTTARETPAELETLIRGVFPQAVIERKNDGIVVDLPLR